MASICTRFLILRAWGFLTGYMSLHMTSVTGVHVAAMEVPFTLDSVRNSTNDPLNARFSYEASMMKCYNELYEQYVIPMMLIFSCPHANKYSDPEFEFLRNGCYRADGVFVELAFYAHAYIHTQNERTAFMRPHSDDTRLHGKVPMNTVTRDRLAKIFQRENGEVIDKADMALCVPASCAMTPWNIASLALPRYLKMIAVMLGGGTVEQNSDYYGHALRNTRIAYAEYNSASQWKYRESYRKLRRWEVLQGRGSTIRAKEWDKSVRPWEAVTNDQGMLEDHVRNRKLLDSNTKNFQANNEDTGKQRSVNSEETWAHQTTTSDIEEYTSLTEPGLYFSSFANFMFLKPDHYEYTEHKVSLYGKYAEVGRMVRGISGHPGNSQSKERLRHLYQNVTSEITHDAEIWTLHVKQMETLQAGFSERGPIIPHNDRRPLLPRNTSYTQTYYLNDSHAVALPNTAKFLTRDHWQSLFDSPDDDMTVPLPSAECCSSSHQCQWAEGQYMQGRTINPKVRFWVPPEAYRAAKKSYFEHVVWKDHIAEEMSAQKTAGVVTQKDSDADVVTKSNTTSETREDMQSLRDRATNIEFLSATNSSWLWPNLKARLSAHPQALQCVSQFLYNFDAPQSQIELDPAKHAEHHKELIKWSEREDAREASVRDDESAAFNKNHTDKKMPKWSKFRAIDERDMIFTYMEDVKAAADFRSLSSFYGMNMIMEYIRDQGAGALWSATPDPLTSHKLKFTLAGLSQCTKFHKVNANTSTALLGVSKYTLTRGELPPGKESFNGHLYMMRLVRKFTIDGEVYGFRDHSFGFCMPAACSEEIMYRYFPYELLLPQHTLGVFFPQLDYVLPWQSVVIDFAIVGFAKCGTSSLSAALHGLPYVHLGDCPNTMPHCETNWFGYNTLDYHVLPRNTKTQIDGSFFGSDNKYLKDWERKNVVLRGVKEPRIIESVFLERFSDETKFIIMVKDPLDALLSHYNEMSCANRPGMNFGVIIRYNLTDCMLHRGWGSWKKRIQERTYGVKERANVLLIHAWEALTIDGIARIAKFLGYGRILKINDLGFEDERETGGNQNLIPDEDEYGLKQKRLIPGDKTDDLILANVRKAFANENPGVIPKRNVREDPLLKFQDIPLDVRELANQYYAEERDWLSKELLKHGSKNDFPPKNDWFGGGATK